MDKNYGKQEVGVGLGYSPGIAVGSTCNQTEPGFQIENVRVK